MKVTQLITTSPTQIERGRVLAEQFSIPWIDASALFEAKPRQLEHFIRAQGERRGEAPIFIFLLSDTGLSLVQVTDEQLLSIRADFYSPSVSFRRHKGGGRGQMIAKAVGLNLGQVNHVLDATAGLGGDAFVLASLGCTLTLTERVPEVRALLADGLRVAREWGALHDATLVQILNRMHLIETDAASHISSLVAKDRPEVIYLDPMFPQRTKSAQVKKEMRVFHQLVGTDADADALLSLARACAQRRVVVKRPRIAPALAAQVPSYTLEGKSNRYDIYVCTAAKCKLL